MLYQMDELPSYYVEEYKTLHHDIGLVKRANGTWDLWFGQDSVSEQYSTSPYLNIVEGDIVSATEFHSLQVGIIVACLTSWNYLNRTGNPIYTNFGNESYSLLKRNKGNNTRYKIKQYFVDCLNRMRRVYSVEYLDVYDVVGNPYKYKVIFKVLSISNTLVDGEFYLDINTIKSTSILDLNYNHPYTSVSNPLFVECILKDEYGSFIEDEIIYIYIKKSTDSKFKFYGITESTDINGKAYVTIPPNGLDANTQIMFVFKGNTIYNPCVSKIITIQVVSYYIKSKYTYKTVTDENDNEVEVVDKHILYVENNLGDSLEKFRLGELLSDYVNLNDVELTNEIPIANIENKYISDEYVLEYYNYDDEEGEEHNKNNKLFLIPTETYIEGTNKKYYNAYAWNNDGTKLLLTPYRIQLNSNKPYEVHFLIDKGDNGLFEIDFGDGHLYYQIELLDNEW